MSGTNILSYRPRTTIISVIIVFPCMVFFPVYRLLNFRSICQAEVHKCPNCLGDSMCNCFINSKFEFSSNHLWVNFLNILFAKKVIFGSCDSQLVVLKWANNVPKGSQFTEIDKNSNMDIFFLSIKSLFEYNPSPTAGFVLCPSSEKLDSLWKPTIDDSTYTPETGLYEQLFYLAQTSMAPVIQQAFLVQKMDCYEFLVSDHEESLLYNVQESLQFSEVITKVRNNFLIRNVTNIDVTKEWAVARYLGACGDIAVSEYCGPTLTSVFPVLSWDKRSSITQQLLLFALNATFDNPVFAFYFTDLSPDNFAVSENNEIRLVDLDNVIVVDKNYSDLSENWNTVHSSYHDENVQGFAFSTEEICSHRISDTNIYSICQGILSPSSDLLPGGLLHSAPVHLTQLSKLVEACTSPTSGQSRFELARSIIGLLSLNDHLQT